MDEVSLSRQARRLRFDDPALEAAFQAHDDERTVRQWRIATGVGAVVIAAVGIIPTNTLDPWIQKAEAVGRYGLMLPCVLAVFAWTWWRAQRERLQLVGVVGTVGSVSFYFCTQIVTSGVTPLTSGLIASLVAVGMQYLVAIAVAVPLRTKAMAAALVPCVAMFYLGLRGIAPELGRRPGLHAVALHFVLTSLAIALVLVAVTWARERLQRIAFVQRRQLERANAELARLNAEKNEFMAIAAHDLRAPLAAVGGVARQLRERPEPAAAVKSAELIEAQTGRMLGLVNDYLGAHAAESGTLPVRRTRLELGATMREAAARHGAAARAKGQTIATDRLPEPVWVEADPALLAQVTDNLVSNALKFSPRGAEVRLEVHTAEGHPRARLAVVDAGPGIAAEEQAHLFRKFGRGSARPTGGESSHGLGLAVAKRLAEAMDGAVGCESEPGAGATFWVELPRAAAGGGT